MRLRIRAHKGLTGPLARAGPRPEARPRRHPRDRVLHPDPPADRRRPRPRAALARGRWRRSPRSPPRAGSTPTTARDARRGLRRPPRRSSTACRCSTTPRPSAFPTTADGPRTARRLLGGRRRRRFAAALDARLERVHAPDRAFLRRTSARPADAPRPEAVFADPEAAARADRRLAAAAGVPHRAGARDLPPARAAR